MNTGSRRKTPFQTSNQKPQQKQRGLSREKSKMQQQRHHDLLYQTKAQQNPAAIFDEQPPPPQQLLPNHPMMSQEYLGQHVYGHQQQKHFYSSMTAEQVRASNDYWYQEFLCRLKREQKKQEYYLHSLQQSRNMKDCYSLTSFLYSENSFLTPWSWNPQAPHTEEKRPMMFQRGSFFSSDIPSAQAKEEEQSRQSQSSKQP